MSNKVNKKFLEEMFSNAPQTTLGIKKILKLDTKKGIASAIYSAKKNMCHSGNIVQGGFITGWLDAVMALACMCKVGSDVLVLSLEIKTTFIKSINPIIPARVRPQLTCCFINLVLSGPMTIGKSDPFN